MSITAFRTEITDLGKVLVDLNKLKIVLVSGLLAVAFGIGASSKAGDYSLLVLSLVPFICIYIDYQYYHCIARIQILARFLSAGDFASEEAQLVQYYELFVHRIRESGAPGIFSFETRAQRGSSVLLAVTCPLLGILAIVTNASLGKSSAGIWMMVVLGVCSLAGVTLVIWSYELFRNQVKRMHKVSLPERPSKIGHAALPTRQPAASSEMTPRPDEEPLIDDR